MMLDRLSENMIHIINKSLYNSSKELEKDKQIISQLIKYDDTNPFSKPILTEAETKKLFMDRVFPYPFENFTEGARTELRIFFPECEFVNGTVVEDTLVIFDIISHQSLYLIKDENGKTLLRPHVIAKHIVDTFNNHTFNDTVGKLDFKKLVNITFDQGFHSTRLIANMMTIGNKR